MAPLTVYEEPYTQSSLRSSRFIADAMSKREATGFDPNPFQFVLVSPVRTSV